MARRATALLTLLLLWGCQDRAARFLGSPPDPAPRGPRDYACMDADADGYGLFCAPGEDCDDADATRHDHCAACGANPQEGCPCDGDETAECHSPRPVVDQHGRLVCEVGERACVDGAWSECVYADAVVIRSDLRSIGGLPVACGNCDPECYQMGGDVEAGDVSPANSDSVSYDCVIVAGEEVCGLVLTRPNGADGNVRYAYVALEPSHGSVTKIRMTDGIEVARYYVGFPAQNSNRPSRTAIDTFGDAYVANRGCVSVSGGAQFMNGSIVGSVTKIAGALGRCVDRNNNGVIDTSNSNAELAAGTDECVLWNAPVAGNVGNEIGSIPRGLAVDRGDEDHPEGYPWVGASVDVVNTKNLGGRAYKLDPTDGSVMDWVALPINAYGAMADGADPQRIWFTSYLTGGLAAVRTDTSPPVVEGPYYTNLPMPGKAAPANYGLASAYAITTDGRRIWRAGGTQEFVRSYDPVTGQHCLVDLPATKQATARTDTRGIAVRIDAAGTKEVWVTEAISQGKLWHFPADGACQAAKTTAWYCKTWGPRSCTATVSEERTENWYTGVPQVVALGASNNTPLGLGMDFDNRVWAINNITNNIAVWDPATNTMLQYPDGPAIAGTYTYSDFTGYQRAMFTLTRGYIFQDYGNSAPVCQLGQDVTWGDLSWEAVVPAGSRIRFEAQTAGDPDSLSTAERVLLGEVPASVSPIYVDTLLAAAGVFQHHRYMRITAWLISDDHSTSPVLQNYAINWICTDRN